MTTRKAVLLVAIVAIVSALATTVLAFRRWPVQPAYYGVWATIVLTIVWPVVVVRRTFRRQPPDTGEMAEACLQLLATGAGGITLTMLLLLRCLMRPGS